MASNRIMRGRAMRRGGALLAALLASATLLGACGGGGGETATAVPDKEGDADLLNLVLGRQMAAVGAYDAVLGGLQGLDLAAARQFRAQEQEHIDAIVKALRGLGAAADPAGEEIKPEEANTGPERLAFLYEVESATIDQELSAIARLTAPAPRSLLGTIVADQAQHLVLLRRALGAKPLDAIPNAFEDGETPAP